MRYFKNTKNEVFGYDDDQQHLIDALDSTWQEVTGSWPPAPQSPSKAELLAQLTTRIQQRLDDFANQRGYDNILSACTYATSKVARFAAEGQCCVEARDATWQAAYSILADVESGARPMPASIADIKADLPVLVWPK